MSDRAKQRAQRIRDEIPLAEVLHRYGYAVHPGSGDHEQQFSCDLHGDGNDTKPSARYYGDHWYCFACGKNRDAIETVREKEGVDFHAACLKLEREWGLPTLDWVDSEEKSDDQIAEKSIFDIPKPDRYEVEEKRLRVLLKSLTDERGLGFLDLLRYWEGYDLVRYRVRESGDEDFGAKKMTALRIKVIEKVRSRC